MYELCKTVIARGEGREARVNACTHTREQMKWRTFGRESLVFRRSRGVILSRGVRYSKLRGEEVKLVILLPGPEQRIHSPSVFASVRVECGRGLAVGVVPVEPHVRTVRVQRFLDVRWEVVSSVDDHTYF